MKTPRCLCCGENLKEEETFYHAKCMKKLFRSTHVPALNYTQDELNALAKETILNRISVPGVQPKLSLHLERGKARGYSGVKPWVEMLGQDLFSRGLQCADPEFFRKIFTTPGALSALQNIGSLLKNGMVRYQKGVEYFAMGGYCVHAVFR